MKLTSGFSVSCFALLLAAGWGAAYDAPLSGTIAINGSSTVAPVTMAAAEMFQDKHPRVRIPVGISGTGGGFKKFLDDQAPLRTDITNASRPITPLELERAKKLGVEFIEVPVAIDGMAVAVHPGNTFCDYLTVAELKRVWEPGSSINNWKDIRPGFPDLPLKLYGPGSDSGTFDYFTLAVVGKERASRSDYTGSENDNVLVQGVSGDRGSLGYFGLSYYETNKSKLKLVAIDPGDGKAVLPSKETIYSGAYRPLARPLFIYVNKASFARPEVRAFVEFFADEAARIAEHPSVRYTALNEDLSKLVRNRVRSGTTGTVFGDPSVAETADLVRLYGGR